MRALSENANSLGNPVQSGQASRLSAGNRIQVEGKHFGLMIQKSEPDCIIPLGTANIHDSVIPVPGDAVHDILQFQLICPSPLRRDRSPDGFIKIKHPTKRACQNLRSLISRIKRFPEQPLIELELPAKSLAET